MLNKFELFDIVVMKKAHPCGSREWQIIRVGADIKLKCAGCGHIILLDRAEFIKKAVRVAGTEGRQ